MTEAALLKKIMLALSRKCILFRNTSGVTKEGDRYIRYGIANPGGSDLIGWTAIEVTQEMVGSKVAIFSAAEIKRPGKLSTATLEQKRFVDAVRKAGGLACIVDSVESAEGFFDTENVASVFAQKKV